MSDILSQEEIDKLLRGIESGDVDTDDLKETIIYVPWSQYLSTMAGFSLPICRLI